MKKIIIAAFIALTTLAPIATAQNNNNKKNDNTDVQTKLRFWEASLPGGKYMVALNRISSVSMHSYIINGSFIVHEVVVDTDGNALARFYAIEAVGENAESNIAKNLIDRGKGIIEQGGSRAGVDTNTLVEKKIDITTHAKTIEYRLFGKSDLDQLYNSASKAWKENRGRKFSIR